MVKIAGWGAKILMCLRAQRTKTENKQYWNKFNKDLKKKWSMLKKKFLKKNTVFNEAKWNL